MRISGVDLLILHQLFEIVVLPIIVVAYMHNSLGERILYVSRFVNYHIA